MLAPAVVDAVEQVDVALYAPQLLFRLARRVNKLGLVGAEAVNEPLPVVLAVVRVCSSLMRRSRRAWDKDGVTSSLSITEKIISCSDGCK